DRRAVEHDFAVERLFELAIGYLDILDCAEDVGELEAHELDLLALRPLENLRLRLFRSAGRRLDHGPNSSQLFGAHLRLKRKRGLYETVERFERTGGCGRRGRPSA